MLMIALILFFGKSMERAASRAVSMSFLLTSPVLSVWMRRSCPPLLNYAFPFKKSKISSASRVFSAMMNRTGRLPTLLYA